MQSSQRTVPVAILQRALNLLRRFNFLARNIADHRQALRRLH